MIHSLNSWVHLACPMFDLCSLRVKRRMKRKVWWKTKSVCVEWRRGRQWRKWSASTTRRMRECRERKLGWRWLWLSKNSSSSSKKKKKNTNIWQGNEIILKKEQFRVRFTNETYQNDHQPMSMYNATCIHLTDSMHHSQDNRPTTSNPVPPESESHTWNVAQQIPNFGTERVACTFHFNKYSLWHFFFM